MSIEITPGAKALALKLIKRFEGCRLHAYQDEVGVWTVGYGCTGPGIDSSTVWTQEMADRELEKRVDEFMRRIVEVLLLPPTDAQLGALTSLVYNIGIDAFLGSHLLEFVDKGMDQAAYMAWLKWDHAGGKVNEGLKKRRETEAAIFLRGSA